MKILTYNLRYGAEGTYDALVEYIVAENPDVVCLQEANNWHQGSPSRLENFAKRTGFDHFEFSDSNTDFNLATFSKLPLVESCSVTDGFWHSALKTVVCWHGDPLTVWNIHLDPRTPAGRLKEAKRLMSMITKPEQTIIVGDFNSISPADTYSPKLLGDLAAKGIKKFGTKKLSFDVMNYFDQARLVDVAAEFNANQPTVPTPANSDAAHTIKLRLDYIITSPDIADAITNVTVVKNKLTDAISDHYPISAILD